MPVPTTRPDLRGIGAAHTHSPTCYWEVEHCRWSCERQPCDDRPRSETPALPALTTG